MVDSCYCPDPVVPERMSQVSKRLEVVYINGAPSTPDYLLALLRELWHVPRGLTEIAEAKQVRKTNSSGILYQVKKKVQSRSSRFEPNIFLISFSRGSGPGPPLIKQSNTHTYSKDNLWAFVFDSRTNLPHPRVNTTKQRTAPICALFHQSLCPRSHRSLCSYFLVLHLCEMLLVFWEKLELDK